VKIPFFSLLFFWFFAGPVWALNEATQTVTLDGVLYRKGTTTPLTDSNVQLKVQILNPAGTCLLYEEQQSVDTSLSKGYFNIQVGSGLASTKRSVNDPGNLMARVFQNTMAVPAEDVIPGSCVSSSYVPAAGDVRYFRITVTPSSTNLADTLTPDILMDSVPQAIVAQSLQGIERAHILQANTAGTVSLNQTNLEALFTGSAWTNLQNILNGNFLQTDSSGAALPSYASTPSGVAAGDIWYDSVTNQIKYQTNSGTQTVGTGSIAGTISVGQGGTNATSFAANRIIASNGTGSAFQAFSCSLNQVISFDGVGNATCANVSSLAGTILNGGNSTGAAISIGTNDNQPLQLKTNNSVAMTISQNGFVGVGTSQPSSALEVRGVASVITSNGGVLVGFGNTALSSDEVVIGKGNSTSANQAVAIGFGNSAGFNTNSTAVGNNNNSSSGGSSFGRSNTTSQAAAIAFGDSNTSSASGAAAFGIGVNNSVANSLMIGPSDSAKLTILSSGNFGIGIVAPTTTLDVSGTIQSRSRVIASSSVQVGADAASCANANKGAMRYNSGNNTIEFCNGTTWTVMGASTCSDSTPNAFAFANEANAISSALTNSDIVQISGINCSVSVQVSGSGTPQVRVCSDGVCSGVVQDWTSAVTSIEINQYLQTRLTTDSVGGSTRSAQIFVGSSATSWIVTTAGGDCVSTTPAPGTVCADGTIYAGLSPDGNVKMFTTRCDAGQTWDGVSCTGSRAVLQWNNGTDSWTNTGLPSSITGKSNSSTLNGLSDAGAPYAAAIFCESLSLNGYTDWYLPARAELNELYSNHMVIRNFETTGNWYWSSTEDSAADSFSQRFQDGFQTSGGGKYSDRLVRCVRR
jgi:hypothetical protein